MLSLVQQLPGSRWTKVHAIETWDPISKQPMFKSGAIRIEKLADDIGEVKVHAKEGHTSRIKQVESTKLNAAQVPGGDEPKRTRRLELLVSALFEGSQHLVEICGQLISTLSNKELLGGMHTMRRLATSIVDRLEPFVQKYRTHETMDPSLPVSLRHSLFPDPDPSSEPHGILFRLHKFYTYLCHIDAQLIMLFPASQALWDQPFYEAVLFTETQTERMMAWARQQMKTRAPQRLLVPAYYVH